MIEKKIYEVGGCVRDKLLGVQSSDVDYVAVGYREDDFSHLVKVGKDFPVFLDENGCEIALARVERKVSSGYNGFEANTINITLEDDLLRRDLTINSIAYDKQNDTYIDPYGGMQDIKNKILRHTSKAFIEDPLRVLRLARFQAKFPQFTIALETKEFVKNMRYELSALQPDRVYKEIKKVMQLQHSDIFFITLLELDVLDLLFPDLYNQDQKHFNANMMILRDLSDQSELLKLTALYCGTKTSLTDIQLPTKLKKKMVLLLKNHSIIFHLANMTLEAIAIFFESYKKDKELFIAQIILVKADKTKSIDYFDEELLLNIFDKISKYSPKKWIDLQEKVPSGESIKDHIHSTNLSYIKSIPLIISNKTIC